MLRHLAVAVSISALLLIAVGAHPAPRFQADCSLLRDVHLMARIEGDGKLTRFAIYRAASTFTTASRGTFAMNSSIPTAVRTETDRIEEMGRDSQRESTDDLNKAADVLALTGAAYREACPEEAAYVNNQLMPR